MGSPNRIALLNRALPVALMAAPDDPDRIASQGAQTIMDIGRAIERRQTAEAAAQTLGTEVRSVTKLGVVRAGEKAAETGIGAAAKSALRIGARVGGFVGRRAIPYVGEAEIAYDVFRLAYQVKTGRSFDTTVIGGAIRRGQDGLWHAGLKGLAAAADGVGLAGVGSFARGPVSEFMTGTAIPDPKANAPGKPDATSPVARPQTAETGGDVALKPGPKTAMTFADWDEKPYRPSPAAAVMPTTPLGRAFAAMDMLVQDVGIGREQATEASRATPVQPRTQSRAGHEMS